MDIPPFSQLPVYSLHRPSLVEDGDVGQKGNPYQRPRRHRNPSATSSEEERVPALEGTSRIIDIHV
jgi:hypothetical protein